MGKVHQANEELWAFESNRKKQWVIGLSENEVSGSHVQELEAEVCLLPVEEYRTGPGKYHGQVGESNEEKEPESICSSKRKVHKISERLLTSLEQTMPQEVPSYGSSRIKNDSRQGCSYLETQLRGHGNRRPTWQQLQKQYPQELQSHPFSLYRKLEYADV